MHILASDPSKSSWQEYWYNSKIRLVEIKAEWSLVYARIERSHCIHPLDKGVIPCLCALLYLPTFSRAIISLFPCQVSTQQRSSSCVDLCSLPKYACQALAFTWVIGFELVMLEWQATGSTTPSLQASCRPPLGSSQITLCVYVTLYPELCLLLSDGQAHVYGFWDPQPSHQ